MDWIQIGLKVAQLGLPTLGSLLGGPLGGAIGGIVAKALGAVDGTPQAVNDKLGTTDNDVLIQKLKSAEAEANNFVEAQAKVAIANSQDIGNTMRAELVNAGDSPGWFGMFQRGWRPAFAWLLIMQCGVFFVLLVHELWTADFSTLMALLQHENFLIWWWGMQFATIGVFGLGRSLEKTSALNAAAQAPSLDVGGVVGKIVDGVKKAVSRDRW
jgi:hypothetical protein